ncbi:unnamed protein product, partial [Notodromas monacha]
MFFSLANRHSLNGQPAVAKVYSAFGHTNGLENGLPDQFIASQVVNDAFFMLKGVDGGVIQFVDDGSLDIELLKTIIMDNGLTSAQVYSQFGSGVRIRVSDFLGYLQSLGITIGVKPPRPQGAIAGNAAPLKITEITSSNISPARPAPRPAADLPAEPPGISADPGFQIVTFQVRGGTIRVVVDDDTLDLALVQRVLIESGLSIQQIRRQLGRDEISLSSLVAYMKSQGFSLVKVNSESSIRPQGKRVRLQLVDGYYLVIIDDGYIDLEYLQRVIVENRLTRNKLRAILESEDIKSQDLVRYFTNQLGIIIDQQYILVKLPIPVRTWTLTLVDGATLSVADDSSIDYQKMQVLIAQKNVGLAEVRQYFSISGPIVAAEFLSFLEALEDKEARVTDIVGSGDSGVFIAKIPTGTRTQQINLPVQSFTVTRQDLSGEIQPVTYKPVVETEIQSIQGPTQIQRFTVKKPVQRIRVIPVNSQSVVEEVVQQIPHQGQIRITQPQVFVSRFESGSRTQGSAGESVQHQGAVTQGSSSQQGKYRFGFIYAWECLFGQQVIGVHPARLNLGDGFRSQVQLSPGYNRGEVRITQLSQGSSGDLQEIGGQSLVSTQRFVV